MEDQEIIKYLLCKGTKAYRKKDYKTAFECFTKAANLGSEEAMSHLGAMYRDGNGVNQDGQKAIEYFEKANNFIAIGKMYKDGDGIEKNIEKAIDYLTKDFDKVVEIDDNYYLASEYLEEICRAINVVTKDNENTFSFSSKYDCFQTIACMYRDGKGVKQNGQKAIEYFKKADNFNAIGEMYRDGNGINQDGQKAVEYLEKDSNFNAIGEMYRDGNDVKQDGQKAVEYFEKAYKLDAIGEMYRDGNGIEQNGQKAIEYFEKVGNFKAISEMYRDGNGVEKDIQKFIEYFEKANLFYEIGCMYREGDNVEKDIQKAIEYFIKALKNGYNKSFAIHELVEMYINGDLKEQYKEKIREWFKEETKHNPDVYELLQDESNRLFHCFDLFGDRKLDDVENAEYIAKLFKVAELGNTKSMYRLGLMYRDGIGVEKNIEKAIDYFMKSVKSVNYESYESSNDIYESEPSAIHELVEMYINGDLKEQYEEKISEWFKEETNSESNVYKLLQDELFWFSVSFSFDDISDNIADKKYIAKLFKAAELGCTKSMYLLGLMYRDGIGVEKNIEKAIDYFMKSDHFCEIGCLYRDGNSVERDVQKAIEYFMKAIDIGIDSLYIYKCIKGIEKDDEDNLSFSSKSEYDCFKAIACMYRDGDGVKQDGQKAIEYFEKAYKLDAIGEMYRDGNGIEQNGQKAIEYFEKAYKLNTIAEMYRDGTGVEQDGQKAIEYFEKTGNFDAIGEMYRDGNGIEQNGQKAIEYFEKTGNFDAIGEMYRDGTGVEQDGQKAIEYFEKTNNFRAIGFMYRDGIGVKQDYQKAIEYFSKNRDWRIIDEIRKRNKDKE